MFQSTGFYKGWSCLWWLLGIQAIGLLLTSKVCDWDSDLSLTIEVGF